MAVYRQQAKCFKCGEPYKPIHRDMGDNFIGDTFVGWDVFNHKCSKLSKLAKKLKGKLNIF